MYEEREENNIKCVFCGSTFTKEMLKDFNIINEGCSSCKLGREVSAVVEIVCADCGRVVYRKELTEVN